MNSSGKLRKLLLTNIWRGARRCGIGFWRMRICRGRDCAVRKACRLNNTIEPQSTQRAGRQKKECCLCALCELCGEQSDLCCSGSKESIDETLRVEGFDVLRGFAEADEFYGDVELIAD